MTITKEQLEAMQRLWIERSTQWEQGAEGPAATDRGSFKCGFLDGIRYADTDHWQTVKHLTCELENWKQSHARLEKFYLDVTSSNAEAQQVQKVQQLEEKLAAAEEALAFYANERSWKLEHYEDVARAIVASDCESVPNYAEYTGGKRAREALAKIRGEG